ncbi:MAG: hypothetical protein VW338_00135 [Rhodospirillaceae bacterium]
MTVPAEANAALIAAAPETAAERDRLREVLAELVRCVRGGDETSGVSMDDALMDADEVLDGTKAPPAPDPLRDAAPELLAAARAMIAWGDAEKTGPDYGSQTRDTHPDGEKIWRLWWDNQTALCERAFDTARAALAKAEGRS